MGCSAPVTLLAAMIDTSPVLGRMAFRNESGSTIPSPSTGSKVSETPSCSSRRQQASTAGCSTALVMAWTFRSPWATREPRMAKASASVPLEVNVIFVRLGAEEFGDLRPRPINGLASLSSLAMEAGRIAPRLPQIRLHGVEDTAVHRRCGCVVEINTTVHPVLLG